MTPFDVIQHIVLLGETVQKHLVSKLNLFLSRYIQPICLPTGRYSNEEFTHTLPLALGWGTTYYDGEEVSLFFSPFFCNNQQSSDKV